MGEREKLQREYARLRRLVKTGARILLLGLGVEIIVLLIFAKGKPWLETASFVLSVIVVIIGVWIEEASSGQAEDVAEKLQQIADSDVASAGERAADANQKAKDAEARAAEANQKAEEARLAFEKFKAPRVLNPEQRALVTTRLGEFAGTKFGLAISLHDPEMEYIATAIGATLKEAGWTWIDWHSGSDSSLRRNAERPEIGTGIMVANVSINFFLPNQELAVAATALHAALEAAGLSVDLEGPAIVRAMMHPYSINILIGRKA